MAKRLNSAERAAAEHFIKHGKKIDAYRHAYDTSRMTDKTAHSNASRLFDRPQVVAFIMEAQTRQQEQFDMEVHDIKKMLAAAAGMGIQKKRDRYGNMVPVSLQGTVAALSEINRMNGNHAPTRSELSAPGGESLFPRSLNDFYNDIEAQSDGDAEPGA